MRALLWRLAGLEPRVQRTQGSHQGQPSADNDDGGDIYPVFIYVKISLGTPMLPNSSRSDLKNNDHEQNTDRSHCVKQTNLIGIAVAFLFVISGNNKYFLHSFDVSYNFNEI